MKKILAVALAIILTLGMAMSVTSCGKLTNDEVVSGRVTPV